MKFKVKRDPETIAHLRQILSHPNMLGPQEVRQLDDEQVAQAAEVFMDSMGGAAIQIAEAFEPIAEAFARLARKIGIIISKLPSDNPLRQIAERGE